MPGVAIRPPRARTPASCSDAPPARSILTAQNLNSGILPVGSISSIVRRLAAASRKWNGMKHVPGVSRCDSRARGSIVPRRELTRTKSPSADAHLLGVVGVHEDVRLGLDRVERERAARHRARVPVLQQPARVEDERVLVRRQLLRRQPLRRHEVREAVVGAEALVEQHDRAVAVRRVGVRIELAGEPEVVVAQAARSWA